MTVTISFISIRTTHPIYIPGFRSARSFMRMPGNPVYIFSRMKNVRGGFQRSIVVRGAGIGYIFGCLAIVSWLTKSLVE